MMFEIPSDQELEEVSYSIGGAIENGEEYIRTLTWSVTPGSGEITYDMLGRSVHVLFFDSERRKFVDIVREGAFRLVFVRGPANCEAVVEFDAESLAGTMRIQLTPHLAIHDSMLLS